MLIIASILTLFGLLMVTSSSMEIAYRQHGQFFYYVTRHVVYFGLSAIAVLCVLQIPTVFWKRAAVYILFITVILLVLVLIPGIGKSVNGSRRWLGLGMFRFQVSECAKLSLTLYLGRYLEYYIEQVRYQLKGFIKPVMLSSVMVALLLKEPDLGASVILFVNCISLLFLAGTPLLPFLGLIVFFVISLMVLVVGSHYRFMRLMSFLDPWQSPFGNSYQLTQSLIACGRGGIFGNGLGESIQKLFYLPEAHTDFVFAIIIEETGLIGGVILLSLFAVLVMQALRIGWRCMLNNNIFQAYVAYGIGMTLALEVIVNVCVNIGLLPTKGLTLPFISYGGSSLMMTWIMVALLLRIDYELTYTKNFSLQRR